MGMKAYPTYKDSGVPWLGEIPEHWGISQYRAYFQERNSPNKNLQESNLLSISYGKIIQKDINKKEGLLPASFESYNIIEDGDIVLRLTDLQNDHKSLRTALCTQKGIITSAYVTLQPINQTVNSAYFQYQLHIYDVRKAIYGAGGGVRQALNYDAIVRLKSCVPSVKEQNAIVAYLDKKCAEIEELIRRRQSIIERLRELKQSIIAEAVTKGLNPDVPLKESSSEWLGQVPKHWELDLLKKFCSPVKYKNSSLDSDTALQFRYGEIIEKSNIDKTDAEYMKTIAEYTVIHPNNIIINGLNMNYDFVSQRVAISTLEGVITSAYLALDINQSILPKYLTYQLKSFDTQKLFHGLGKGIRLTLTYKILSRILITVPPYEEQKEIVNYLDKKCAKIDELISRHEQTIEKLKKLKTATIAHVVTGKMDVRDAI